ncbi:AbrB/MazE/SpoVT family DNA-binding domain-containing protein [Vulcanisaeta sp. JCM 16161]|uniref:AbrB/MazE/SpoVT family DNA-binding domain-containing protein n=1 Tax=Vulcanisaeta sp. JCM 16161 TaxID=1295372 RepID=UPI001FB49064|nr:AbrB/MazE/SpoVT family DNA-binding domain-containing protein [Vulcanisaeta sp. JCM 16161]
MGNCLPVASKVYVNNQVLVPARVVKCLGIKDVDYVDVVIKYGGEVIELRGVKLLRSVKGGASRQFTIPRDIRERFGIQAFDTVEIISIRPSAPLKLTG